MLISSPPFFAFRNRTRGIDFVFSLLLFCLVPCFANTALAQAAAPNGALAGSAMDELPARMQAVGAAQQTGDVTKIASANRNLIASAMRAMAELKLAQGSTAQAIDL